jgi:hypothetical protein
MRGNKRRFILIGLSFIAIIYLLYNIFLVDASYYENIPRTIRHLFRFLSIILVFGAGYFSLKNYGVKWIIDLWNVMYFIIVPLLVLTGLYDLFIGPAPVELKNISKTLHEFLISPVFFVAILIISKNLGKINKTPEKRTENL